MTSKAAMMGRKSSDHALQSQKPRVSRETVLELFQTASLADTELAEHDIQEILNVDPARDPADGPHSEPEIFSQQLDGLGRGGALQGLAARLERVAMPRPGQNGLRPDPHSLDHGFSEGTHQLLDPIARSGTDSKCRLAADGDAATRRREIDL